MSHENAPGPAEPQVRGAEPAAVGGPLTRVRALFHARVRVELRRRLNSAKTGSGKNAKALDADSKEELLAGVTESVIDAATEEAQKQHAQTEEKDAEHPEVGGPVLDFLLSPEFLNLVVTILMKWLGT